MQEINNIRQEIICGDCLDILPQLSDVDMIVTSPPYYNARQYSQFESYEEYKEFIGDFLRASYVALADHGRIAVNVPDGYGRLPWIPIYADTVNAMRQIGFVMRGSIIWDKGTSRDKTAWGSWLSSSNPHLLDEHEVIIVAHKKDPGLPRSDGQTITKERFFELIHSVWRIPPERNRLHPAPFPLEIPLRLIELYTVQGALVVDPFVGSGTTGVACVQLNRRFIGIDYQEDYCQIAIKRIMQAKNTPKQLAFV